jgi:hypothetical protein
MRVYPETIIGLSAFPTRKKPDENSSKIPEWRIEQQIILRKRFHIFYRYRGDEEIHKKFHSLYIREDSVPVRIAAAAPARPAAFRGARPAGVLCPQY